MAATLNITHDDIYADIRAYLLGLFPAWEVVQGYSNNVPLPNAPFVLMNIINESDVSTNVHKYDKAAQIATVTRTVETMMQLDFYGEQSGETARIFVNLWRDYHATERLTKCQPLFCEQPKYLPWSNEYGEFEQRWLVTAYLSYNPAVTHAQDFVTHAEIVTELI